MPCRARPARPGSITVPASAGQGRSEESQPLQQVRHCRRWARPLRVDLGQGDTRQSGVRASLREGFEGEIIGNVLPLLGGKARQSEIVALGVLLVLVIVNRFVMSVEPDLEAGHGNNAVHNGPLATQPSAFGQKVMTVPTIMVLCLWTWVTVLCQDIGDTSVGSGGDTCGLRLSGELR